MGDRKCWGHFRQDSKTLSIFLRMYSFEKIRKVYSSCKERDSCTAHKNKNSHFGDCFYFCVLSVGHLPHLSPRRHSVRVGHQLAPKQACSGPAPLFDSNSQAKPFACSRTQIKRLAFASFYICALGWNRTNINGLEVRSSIH